MTTMAYDGAWKALFQRSELPCFARGAVKNLYNISCSSTKTDRKLAPLKSM